MKDPVCLPKKSIYQLADIDTGKIFATYFPYPERTECIAYSKNVNGHNSYLHLGCASRKFYLSDSSNSGGGPTRKFTDSFGEREKGIINHLDHIETVEHDADGKSIIAFIAKNGSRFSAATFDHGHSWQICG